MLLSGKEAWLLPRVLLNGIFKVPLGLLRLQDNDLGLSLLCFSQIFLTPLVFLCIELGYKY